MAAKPQPQETSQTTTGQTPRKAKKMSDLKLPGRTDAVEYVKAEDLERIFPFTIFSASPSKGRYGDRIRFGVAWKEDGQVVKKVLTVSANDERNALMHDVRRHGAVTNCRLYILDTGNGTTYNKIVDADEPPPDESVSATEVANRDDDIPF